MDVIWEPTAEVLERANVVRLMRRLGVEDYWELVRRSSEEPEWFWPAAIEDMGIEFSSPWERVYDDSRGPEWTTWFVGGKVNIARVCVHDWARRTPDAVAAVLRGENGDRREWTYAELSQKVTRFAEALVSLGVESGDRVAIFMPMAPAMAVASHACAHIGAVQVPIFSGFAAPAIAQRLQDAEAKVLLTASHSFRRGREMPMRVIADEAVAESPSVEHVVEWDRASGRWDVELGPGELAPLEVDSEHPYLLTYTSGTTGKPKGVLHVQGGFLVSIAREVAYQADGHPGDVMLFATDMGWIMGPWTVVGGGAMGCTLVFMEGAPDWPHDRLWKLIEEECVNDPRLLADADPGADPVRRARRGYVVAADDRDYGRALESRPVPVAVRAGRRRPLPDHQLLGRDGGGRVLPVADAGDSDQGELARRARTRNGDGRRRRRRALGARRGR